MTETGVSKNVEKMLKFISTDKINAIDKFYNDCLERDYTEFKDAELALMNINVPTLSEEDADVLLNYSGYNYKNINNVLRNRWNYEENGLADKAYYAEIANRIKSIINNNQTSIGNCKLFRGVSLEYLKEYGITSLDDIEKLRGNILLDKGFVSTSLVDEKCFYKKENDLGINYNVKIEYLVPEEFEDGICLSSLSYSPGQCEYLINAWNMARVVDVIHDENGAILKAILIPKKIYDEYYSYGTGSVK